MPRLFILDTPEFEPIVHAAREAGMHVRGVGDYLEATSSGPEVTIERTHANVRPSIWFAALTAGLVGRIRRFDHDVLCIADHV